MLLERLDRVIEKMSEVSNNISRLLAVHETKIDVQDESINVLHRRLSDLKDEMNKSMERNTDTIRSEFEKVKGMFEKQNNRLALLEQWKYAVVMCAAFIGFLLSEMNLSKLF
tara:strand:- start:1767 stop:2102 length:336 start_codon:yes stop_codon:yes gene_type:complete